MLGREKTSPGTAARGPGKEPGYIKFRQRCCPLEVQEERRTGQTRLWDSRVARCGGKGAESGVSVPE